MTTVAGAKLSFAILTAGPWYRSAGVWKSWKKLLIIYSNIKCMNLHEHLELICLLLTSDSPLPPFEVLFPLPPGNKEWWLQVRHSSKLTVWCEVVNEKIYEALNASPQLFTAVLCQNPSLSCHHPTHPCHHPIHPCHPNPFPCPNLFPCPKEAYPNLSHIPTFSHIPTLIPPPSLVPFAFPWVQQGKFSSNVGIHVRQVRWTKNCHQDTLLSQSILLLQDPHHPQRHRTPQGAPTGKNLVIKLGEDEDRSDVNT